MLHVTPWIGIGLIILSHDSTKELRRRESNRSNSSPVWYRTSEDLRGILQRTASSPTNINMEGPLGKIPSPRVILARDLKILDMGNHSHHRYRQRRNMLWSLRTKMTLYTPRTGHLRGSKEANFVVRLLQCH